MNQNSSQFRNFLKHAELVGIFNAVFGFLWSWITLDHIRYTETGCMICESEIDA